MDKLRATDVPSFKNSNYVKSESLGGNIKTVPPIGFYL